MRCTFSAESAHPPSYYIKFYILYATKTDKFNVRYMSDVCASEQEKKKLYNDCEK